MAPSPRDVTQLLLDWNSGDRHALDELIPLVYDELRRLADHYMRGERADHTLQPTALVHEAYIRLIDQRSVHWQNRAHFFGVAASLIRRILVDHARAHKAAKRGGNDHHLALDQAASLSKGTDVELVALDDALISLEALDPKQARIVELRFFARLSIKETAEVLGISPATVKREWSVAKAWLYREAAGRRPQ